MKETCKIQRSTQKQKNVFISTYLYIKETCRISIQFYLKPSNKRRRPESPQIPGIFN